MADDDDLTAAIAMSMGETAAPTTTSPTSVLEEAGLASNFKGTYELYGVVTHKGRSADAGHYMGWVRIKGGACVPVSSILVLLCYE
jgi:ubiquitin carboxyl-terminal hydrolase 14